MIYIFLMPNSRKIFIYDNYGNFKNDVQLDFIASSFLILNDLLLFDKFNMTEAKKNKLLGNNLLICNKKGKVINGFLSIDESLSVYNMGAIYGLQLNDKVINYLPPISNRLFQYNPNNNEIENIVLFDFEKNWPDENFFEANLSKHPAEVVNLIQEKNLVSFLNYIENNNHICIAFYHGYKKVIGFVSKEDYSYELYDFDNSPFELLPLTIDEEGRFVSIIYPELIDDWAELNLNIPENIKNNQSNVLLIKYSVK
jgi:hypothetical protein